MPYRGIYARHRPEHITGLDREDNPGSAMKCHGCGQTFVGERFWDRCDEPYCSLLCLQAYIWGVWKELLSRGERRTTLCSHCKEEVPIIPDPNTAYFCCSVCRDAWWEVTLRDWEELKRR